MRRKKGNEIEESVKRLNGYYQKSNFDINALTHEEKEHLFSNCLTEGPEIIQAIVVPEKSVKCFFSGCKTPAVNHVTKKWGDKDSFCTCAEHTPNAANRPDYLKNMPFCYTVKPIE